MEFVIRALTEYIIDNDLDNDGVCDNDEVAGCQDLSACNYNPVATDDDNSCFYPAEQYLDCYGNCINDGDGDGICNELEILGCTDTNACNYDFNSTENDGSCTYSFVGLDCFGNCINDLDNDGVCDENEILGCTNPSAVNFNNLATEDNNSCDFGPFGEITETDCIMTIVFSEDFSLSYGNQVFSEGWIGVTDADGNIYGSTFWSEGQNNSIMAYGSNINNEGIEYNEELNWIFSFNNNNIIMSPVYGFADGIFSCSDLAIIESLSSDLPGCLDSEAFNFNNLANVDDNSCDYGPWDEIPNTDCNMTILIPETQIFQLTESKYLMHGLAYLTLMGIFVEVLIGLTEKLAQLQHGEKMMAHLDLKLVKLLIGLSLLLKEIYLVMHHYLLVAMNMLVMLWLELILLTLVYKIILKKLNYIPDGICGQHILSHKIITLKIYSLELAIIY